MSRRGNLHWRPIALSLSSLGSKNEVAGESPTLFGVQQSIGELLLPDLLLVIIVCGTEIMVVYYATPVGTFVHTSVYHTAAVTHGLQCTGVIHTSRFLTLGTRLVGCTIDAEGDDYAPGVFGTDYVTRDTCTSANSVCTGTLKSFTPDGEVGDCLCARFAKAVGGVVTDGVGTGVGGVHRAKRFGEISRNFLFIF